MNRLEYVSEKESLHRIIESRGHKEVQFNIPMYQRLYVWEDEQIKTLLEDILEAFQRDRVKDEDEIMYLGTVVLDEHHVKEEDRVGYDLVDGQQRFTTLWLLSLLFGRYNAMGRFTSIPASDTTNPLRLTFSIREEVSDFFEFLYKNIGQEEDPLSGKSLHRIKNLITESETLEESGRDGFLYKDKRIDKIRNGLKVLSQVLIDALNDSEQEICSNDLSQFIFDKVKFVTVKVPDGGDLNQLFETLNNRGEQLLQEDVVKAKLLDNLEDDTKKALYNRLWVSCSAMDDYVEDNLKAGGIASKDIYDKLDKMYNDKGELNVDIFSLENNRNRNGSDQSTGVGYILGDNFRPPDESKDEEEQKEDEKNKDREESGSDAEVESIISFPQLLLHTLRIYDVIYNSDKIGDSDIYYPAVDEKRLIDIFEERLQLKNDTLIVEDFINLLWEVRFIFDNAVVKWVEQGGDRELMLQKLEKSDEYLSRDYSSPGEKAGQQPLHQLQMLQRMLYHTQDPRKHNWLTPYLYKTLIGQKRDIRFKEENFGTCFDLLEYIDNLMFCSSLKGDRREQTHKLCKNSFEVLVASEDITFERYNNILISGLDTPHYWFYKIDLLLFIQQKGREGAIGKWKNFKMNSRNSIEHVLPRNAKSKIDCKKDKEKILNRWIGNLALVSTVDNATYNNGYFSEKKNKYKQINGSVPPSLKLDWIYGHDEWKIQGIEEHQLELEKLLGDYFRSISSGYF